MIYEEVIKKIKEASSRRRIEPETYRRLSLALGHNHLEYDYATTEFIYELLMMIESTKRDREELISKLYGINENVKGITKHYDNMKKNPIARKDYITKVEVLETLRRCNDNKGLAATVLECSRQTIYNRLKE